MSVLKWQVHSSANLSSYFKVITDNFPVNFQLIHFLLQKNLIKFPILTLLSALVKICQIPHFTFQTTSQLFFKNFYQSSVSCKITPLCFFRSNDIYFEQMEPIIVGILSILSVQVKLHQIFVIFETKSQFFFKICITIQCHDT